MHALFEKENTIAKTVFVPYLNTERKVILYIAMSVDGCITILDDNIDFLNMVYKEGQD
jgi:hypothetical protein